MPKASKAFLAVIPALFVLAMICATSTPIAAAGAAERPSVGMRGDVLGWYRRAAQSGDANAQFYLGLIIERGTFAAPDPVAALSWYRKAAKSGHALARLKLAQALHFGAGTPRDLVAARRWYLAAAAQDVAEAAFNVALMMLAGEGGATDIAGAVPLLEQAAAAGIDGAPLQLGIVHGRGEGVALDLVEALKWFLLAKEDGDERAEALIATVSQALDADARAEAEKRVKAWRAVHPGT